MFDAKGYFVTVAVASLIGASPVAAQDKPPNGQQTTAPVATFRTEVVVTAERGTDARADLPVSTAVLTAEQLKERPAASLADAAQMLPGFQILSADASAIPPSSIARGFFGAGEAEYVKVLVDGIPLGDVESGVVDWRRVPAFAIGRIEALRGPASAVYGDTALGGVVQVFTIAPTESVAQASVAGGSFGTASAGGGFSRSVAGASFQVLGSYDRTDGFRSQSARREGFASASAHRSFDSHQWTARGAVNITDREEPGALTAAQMAADRAMSDSLFQLDRDENTRGYGAFRYAFTTTRLASSVLGRLSARDGTRLRTLLLVPGLGDRAHRDTTSTGAGLSIENSLATNAVSLPGHLRFGLDIARDRVGTAYQGLSTDGITTNGIGSIDGRRWQFAGYAAQSIAIGGAITLNAGLRWDGLRDGVGDATRVSHDAWSPRAGGVLDVGRGIVVFGQVSRAFKAPTLDQLFDPRPFPDFRGGTFLISSPALRPQRATNVEGGVRQLAGRYRWEALVYHMRVRDEIDFDPATFTYANIGRSVHEGLEADAALFQGTPVAVGVNYAWTRVVPTGAPDAGQLKNIPRHLFRPDVTLSLPREVTLHVRYTRTAGAYLDDPNQFRLGDRSSVDMRVAKRFSRVVARVDLLNVTDDHYEEVGYVLPDFRGGVVPFYYPAPGFAARAGFDVMF